jgi:glycosyltransferase involved in cell wall biosynthesis
MDLSRNAASSRYVIITPVRDEAKFLGETIRSVASQTITPLQWIIVDDGSTDATAEIMEAAAAKHPWITTLHCANRGSRVNASGVMQAFHQGYQLLNRQDWDYLVKLDGDVRLEPDYFEKCIAQFHKNPSLGVGGGVIYNVIGDSYVLEPCPEFHVRGATKIYRRECWDAIGGLLSGPGWDTVDEVKANMLIWKSRSFPELKVIHFRPTGQAEGSWKNSVKDGRSDYVTGYHPLFMFLKCVKRIVEPPVVVGSVGLMYGFVSSYFRGVPRVEKDLIQYVQRQQLRRLMLMNSIWK